MIFGAREIAAAIAMRQQLELRVTWLAERMKLAAARVDPELLQWPGGAFIAIFLWICAWHPRPAALAAGTSRR